MRKFIIIFLHFIFFNGIAISQVSNSHLINNLFNLESNVNDIRTMFSSSCPMIFKDSRDGKKYKIVGIGEQCWFAENLNYDPPNLESWCYNDNPKNCKIYGRLYDWYTIMNNESSSESNPSGVKGICPEGWHVPSVSEWKQLIDFLGGMLKAGAKMTSKKGWDVQNKEITNSSGFTALPGGEFGMRGFVGSENDIYQFLGFVGFWWSSSEFNSSTSWHINISFLNYFAKRAHAYKTDAFSCRCIMDKEQEESL